MSYSTEDPDISLYCGACIAHVVNFITVSREQLSVRVVELVLIAGFNSVRFDAKCVDFLNGFVQL